MSKEQKPENDATCQQRGVGITGVDSRQFSSGDYGLYDYCRGCYSCETCYTCQVMVDDVHSMKETPAPPSMAEYEEELFHIPIRDTQDTEKEKPLKGLLIGWDIPSGRKTLKLGSVLTKIIYFCSFKWLKIRLYDWKRGEK